MKNKQISTFLEIAGQQINNHFHLLLHCSLAATTPSKLYKRYVTTINLYFSLSQCVFRASILVQIQKCEVSLLPPSRDVGHLEGYYILAMGFKRWRGGPSTGGPERYGWVGFSTYVIDWPWSSMVWSAFITEFSRPRNHLRVWCMDLGQQLRLLHPTSGKSKISYSILHVLYKACKTL